MKKIITILLVSVISLALVACDSKDYSDAEALFEAGNYADAHQIYTRLGDYNDSSEKAKECTYLLGQAAYDEYDWDLAIEYLTDLNYKDSEKMLTDCMFITDLKTSILSRMDQNKRNTDYKTLTMTEMAHVGKYSDAVFFSPEIAKYAEEYIDGLNTQKDALSLQYSEYQIAWQEGIVKRYHVLYELLTNYGFLDDNVDFVATYSEYDYQADYLEALKAINQDLLSQLEGYVFDMHSYYFSGNYHNNTKYAFDLQFYFYLSDSNNVRVEETYGYFKQLQPDSENKLNFYYSNSWRYCEFFWEILNVKTEL